METLSTTMITQCKYQTTWIFSTYAYVHTCVKWIKCVLLKNTHTKNNLNGGPFLYTNKKLNPSFSKEKSLFIIYNKITLS